MAEEENNDNNIININNRSSNIATHDSNIISDSLSGRELQQREVDLVRDPVAKLNYDNSNWRELPADVKGVSKDRAEAFLISDNQNINVNNSSSSNIAADGDSNMTMTEQKTVCAAERQTI